MQLTGFSLTSQEPSIRGPFGQFVRFKPKTIIENCHLVIGRTQRRVSFDVPARECRPGRDWERRTIFEMAGFRIEMRTAYKRLVFIVVFRTFRYLYVFA